MDIFLALRVSSRLQHFDGLPTNGISNGHKIQPIKSVEFINIGSTISMILLNKKKCTRKCYPLLCGRRHVIGRFIQCARSTSTKVTGAFFVWQVITSMFLFLYKLHLWLLWIYKADHKLHVIHHQFRLRKKNEICLLTHLIFKTIGNQLFIYSQNGNDNGMEWW